MESYEQIQAQVGAWNIANFGNQETPYLKVVNAGTVKAGTPRGPEDKPGLLRPLNPVVVELGSMAPLMGIVEEVGELYEATGSLAIEDAIGDIAIYLCDYCCRENIPFPSRVDIDPACRMDPKDGLVVYLGRLHHVHLKRHQRIRGMHDRAAFSATRDPALRAFVWHLEAYAKAYTKADLLIIINTTWGSVVKKRDWLTEPITGGGDQAYHQKGQ